MALKPLAKFTPREIRTGLKDKSLSIEKAPLPAAPVEWKQWRREKIARDAEAAWFFLVKGLTLEKIALRMELNGPDGQPLSKQRLNQYVARGCRFLIDRRYVRKAK